MIMLVFISLNILLAALAGLAMLSLSCRHLICPRAIVLCGLCGLGDWGVGLAWECVIDAEWM